jgi:hypothetical protein
MTLWDLRCKLDEFIAAKKLDRFDTYGKVTLVTGQLIPRITATTAGTPEQIEKLRQAIAKVLGVQV